ncbi:hypothetical protein B0T25DRAFT_554818 [Lasiosphaeria hispida]|uniref:Uncharacterized protein n=1 Tax=Lasiosphaeria hispida TaxID=260671 RepID=A0AAJ0M9J3_9PEZI|nr:hypothetical protein B0T25DRAFT_554818 [Lasiosphaeria hispida]
MGQREAIAVLRKCLKNKRLLLSNFALALALLPVGYYSSCCLGGKYQGVSVSLTRNGGTCSIRSDLVGFIHNAVGPMTGSYHSPQSKVILCPLVRQLLPIVLAPSLRSQIAMLG